MKSKVILVILVLVILFIFGCTQETKPNVALENDLAKCSEILAQKDVPKGTAGWERMNCFALAVENPELCEEIPLNYVVGDTGYQAGGDRDTCYYDAGVQKKDASLCEKINPGYVWHEINQRDMCLYIVGVQTDDTLVCKKINDINDKSDCLDAIN